MAAIPAVVILSVSNGATPGQTVTELQAGGVANNTALVENCITSLPLLATDQTPIVAGQSYPIRVPASGTTTSAERVFRVKLNKLAQLDPSGDNTDNKIRTVKVWQSTATPSGDTNCRLWVQVKIAYTAPQPAQTAISQAQALTQLEGLGYVQMPTTVGTAINVTIGGEVYQVGVHDDAELHAEGDYTDYVYMVLDVYKDQTQGGSATIYVSYDEVS